MNTLPPSTLEALMPTVTGRRTLAILPLVGQRPQRSPVPTREHIESLQQPEVASAGVRFDYTHDELLAMAHDTTPGTPGDIRRVVRYALVWSGMRISDGLIHWSTLDHGYIEGTRLPRVTLPIDDKRLSVRIVPDSWVDSLQSHFLLERAFGTNACITLSKNNGSRVEVARPISRYVTESVQTLSYLVEQTDGTKSVTINPLQRCPQTCEYCCRGYHDMTRERMSELVNLRPDEMAQALIIKYPAVNWKEVSGITLITGDFRDDKQILRYMERLVGAMDNVTNGAWNSITNPHQDITVSTHLIRTREAMEAAKALGMKRFIHTVEMADDTRREDVMHLGRAGFEGNSMNKGHASFEEVLSVLETAIEVFGVENVEPVFVLGLDPLHIARTAMDRIRALGIQRVSRGLINAYHMNQLSLVPQPLENAIAAMQYARELFGSPYRRVVTEFQNPNELHP